MSSVSPIAGQYKPAEHMARGSPVGAVGLQIGKRAIMDTSRGRVLSHHAVMYILAGRGFFQDSPDRRRPVEPGALFYLYPGRWHWFDPDPGTAWTEYWVVFDGFDAERRFGQLLPPESAPLHFIGRDQALIEAYEELHDVWLYGTRGYAQHATYLLHRILATAFLAVQGIAAPRKDDLVHLTKEMVGGKLDCPSIDFERFAASQGMSYERFRKRFKSATGLAPKQFHLNARLNRACSRLLNQNLSVKEVAREVGFEDALYFSRIFKAKTGVSPEGYRRLRLGTGVPAST